MDSVVPSTQKKMQEAFDMLRDDFATVRTGKASPTLVENIEIVAYNGTTKLRVMELATIHAQDTQTLVISPFDHSVIGDIEKGIVDVNVGLNPIVDGDIIRISIPPLTEERRRELVKMINQKAENGKVMLRQERHEAMEEIKKKGEGAGVSEDDIIRLEKDIQRLTDEFMGKVDTLREEKEVELMKM